MPEQQGKGIATETFKVLLCQFHCYRVKVLDKIGNIEQYKGVRDYSKYQAPNDKDIIKKDDEKFITVHSKPVEASNGQI